MPEHKIGTREEWQAARELIAEGAEGQIPGEAGRSAPRIAPRRAAALP